MRNRLSEKTEEERQSGPEADKRKEMKWKREAQNDGNILEREDMKEEANKEIKREEENTDEKER